MTTSEVVRCNSLCFLRQASHWSRGWQASLGWLSSKQQGYRPVLDIIIFLNMVSGDWTQIPRLAKQGLYQLSHLPSSVCYPRSHLGFPYYPSLPPPLRSDSCVLKCININWTCLANTRYSPSACVPAKNESLHTPRKFPHVPSQPSAPCHLGKHPLAFVFLHVNKVSGKILYCIWLPALSTAPLREVWGCTCR